MAYCSVFQTRKIGHGNPKVQIWEMLIFWKHRHFHSLRKVCAARKNSSRLEKNKSPARWGYYARTTEECFRSGAFVRKIKKNGKVISMEIFFSF